MKMGYTEQKGRRYRETEEGVIVGKEPTSRLSGTTRTGDHLLSNGKLSARGWAQTVVVPNIKNTAVHQRHKKHKANGALSIPKLVFLNTVSSEIGIR